MMGKNCRSDLLEERSESAAYKRGCAVHELDGVLTVLTSEEAESGAVNEGVRPLRFQTRSALPSETLLSHQASLLIHLNSDRRQRPKVVRNRHNAAHVVRPVCSYFGLTDVFSGQRSQAQKVSTALCYLLVMLCRSAGIVIFTSCCGIAGVARGTIVLLVDDQVPSQSCLSRRRRFMLQLLPLIADGNRCSASEGRASRHDPYIGNGTLVNNLWLPLELVSYPRVPQATTPS
jgi:hypothetical protein